MATSLDYVEYVCDQVRNTGDVRYKKMFGEYMVYVDDRPILLVCDDTVFVKILPCFDGLMANAEKAFPYSPEKYPSVRKHYVLDIDNIGLVQYVVAALLPVTAVPKPRKKKGGKINT
jgi:TfoX/Sxy family transcriptional regulator of competence genes